MKRLLAISLAAGSIFLTGCKDATPTAPTAAVITNDIVQSIDIGTECDYDKNVINPATSFNFGVDNFCYVVGVQPSASTVLKVSVYAIESDVWNNQLLYQKDNYLTEDTDKFQFTLGRKAGWPRGTYKVEINLNEQTIATQDYLVE